MLDEPWTAASYNKEETYASQMIDFEGQIFFAQRCGAGRTIGKGIEEGSFELDITNTPVKTYAGYKLYTPRNEYLYLFAHSQEPIEMLIADNANAFYTSLVAIAMTFLFI